MLDAMDDLRKLANQMQTYTLGVNYGMYLPERLRKIVAELERPLTIREWIEVAPLENREELQCVPVMNFLREHRNSRFQLIGMHDGSMSEECKELQRTGYKAMDELIQALVAKTRPQAEYNPYEKA